MSIYGDSIFTKPNDDMSLLYNEFIESSKLFIRFDDILTEDASSVKEKIIITINKIIQKIKDFIKWIKTAVKKMFDKIAANHKASNLKKFIKDAKDKLKNKSTNESSILIEATYNDLEDLLQRTLVPYYKLNYDSNKILDLIRTDANNLRFFKVDGTNLVTGSDFPIIEHKTCTMETFINKYFEENYRELMGIEVRIEDSINDFRKSIDQLESVQSEIRSKDINSLEDLKNAIKTLKNNESVESLPQKYHCAVENCVETISYVQKALFDIERTEKFIREKVKEKLAE